MELVNQIRLSFSNKTIKPISLVFIVTLILTIHSNVKAENNELVKIYNEQQHGDLNNVAAIDKEKGNLGILKPSDEWVVIGSLASEDYRDSIFFVTEEKFTISIMYFSGDSEELVTFGFGPEFQAFADGVETVTNKKELYQGKKLQAGGYRFDFGAPGGPQPNLGIDHYAVHIRVDSGLESLPNHSLKARIGNNPHFLRANENAFLLENQEWSAMEAFIATVINLPSTQQELVHHLSLDSSINFNLHFKRLKETYTRLRKDALVWEQEAYPSILKAAHQFVIVEEITRTQLIKTIREDLLTLDNLLLSASDDVEEFQQMNHQSSIRFIMFIIAKKIEQLQKLFGTSLELTQTSSEESIKFSTNLQINFEQLGIIKSTFLALFNEKHAETVRVQDEIQQLSKKITSKNKQISDKERRLALSASGGPIAAAIAASILVPQIKKLKKQRDDLNKKLTSKHSQFDTSTKYESAYENAKNDIEWNKNSIADVRGNFNQLKLQWQSLQAEMRVMKDTLNPIVFDEETNALIYVEPNIFSLTVAIIINSISDEIDYMYQKNQSYISYKL